ncbi:MAG: phosphoribosyltransferase family protein [Candidatus Shapirobacteria bacterium]
MRDFYDLAICGLQRKLPLIGIGKNTKIASLNISGDVLLIRATAKALYKKLKKYDFDYLVGPEVKVVPLIDQLANIFNHKHYVICRKSRKPHMINPLVLKPLPHFPKHVKPLVIDGLDRDLIKGKKVAIVDDVISTGVTMRMMKKLMEKCEADIVVFGAIVKQGEKLFEELEPFEYLVSLPIFKSES